mgnify:CR=1 FL=1
MQQKLNIFAFDCYIPTGNWIDQNYCVENLIAIEDRNWILA